MSFRVCCSFVMTLCLCLACEKADPPASVEKPDPASEISPLLATVEGRPIYEHEFESYLGLVQGDRRESTISVPRKELFQEFVLTRLMASRAREEGIEITEEDLQRYAEQWLPPNMEVGPGVLENIRELIISQKLIHREVSADVEISLSEMQVYYEEHADEFKVDDQAHVFEILVPTRREILELVSLLERGDVNQFKKLARLHSNGVTAASGGDLGTFEHGQLPEKFNEVIFSLSPGDISAPFQSDRGFHLFLVEERIPRHDQKFHEVRDHIFGILAAEEERRLTEEFVAQALGEAEIEIFQDELAFDSLDNEGNEDFSD